MFHEPYAARPISRLETWRRAAWRRSLTIGERLDAHRRTISILITSVIVLTALVVFLALLGHDTNAVTRDQHPLFVQSGDLGVVLDQPSRAIACTELRTGRFANAPYGPARLVANAEHSLLERSLPCVCAPMFGTPLQHIAVRGGDGVDNITHAFNPSIKPIGSSQSVLQESQALFFPNESQPVQNVRYDRVRMTFIDSTCVAHAIELRDAHAYCVQICADLIDGISVYRRACLLKN